MNHGSLFSGIGGFDLAAEWMGWNNVFHCEWMPFPRQVLKHHFPNSISYEDITKTDFTIHRGTIDVLTGGFPCQPYSVAGKRLGKEDKRHLWPEMLRAIREIRPRFVVGENVRGLVNWNGGMVFDEVQADLENEGYEVIPFIIPACAVGAPHRRDRVWFVAQNTNKDGWGSNEWKEKSNIRKFGNACSRNNEWICTDNAENKRHAIDANNARRSDGHQEVSEAHGEISERNENTKPCHANKRDAIDTERIRRNEKRDENGIIEGTQKEKRGEKQFSGANSSQSRWRGFPSQSPICSGDDGLPAKLDGITFSKWRNESIKGYGNAIVPQVVYEIFKAIEKSVHE